MRKRISKTSLTFKGDAARGLLAALCSDVQLLEMSKNEMMAPEMKEALTRELIKRDLLEGNWQI